MQAVRGLSNLPSKTFSSSSSSSASATAALRYSPLSKTVFNEISNAICGHSNIRRRGRAFAATLPSDPTPKPQTGGRKYVTRDERRAMVKAFVEKYRDSNAGKYPTPSAARKQVGGSYYSVKNILEEIIYNSKKSPTTDKTPMEVPKEECLPSPVVTEVPSSIITADLINFTQSLELKDESQPLVNNNLDTDEASNNSFEAKEETIGSIDMPPFEESIKPKTADHPNSDKTCSPQMNFESQEVSHLCVEDPESSKKAATSEASVDLNGPKVVREAGQEDSKSVKLKRDVSREEKEEYKSPNRPTVWGNLKSLADGVMNLWRKM